jgi:hypothetical protein
MHLEKFEKVTLSARDRMINNCCLVAKVLENEKCLRITKLASEAVRF